jgi:nicotinate-nucleotide pyrophosphorylase (carboxylating)
MTPPTLPILFQKSAEEIAKINAEVKSALEEDIGNGDLTAQLVPANAQVKAAILVREKAVICGIDWVNACFKQVDPSTKIDWHIQEGQAVNADQVLCHITGEARALLTAERCALNFLQTLSATATQTRQFVDAITGTKAKILDTRKTIPHFRYAQKYAVRVGGGENQRFALYDGILIKENHIAAAGSIANVLNQARAINRKKSIQIEVENIAQLKEALTAGATSILLDNFDIALLKDAVKINNSFQLPAVLEASGGIDLKNVREIAETGVDRISIGSITKNIRAIDLSMRILH